MNEFKVKTFEGLKENFKKCRLCKKVYMKTGMRRHYNIEHKKELERFMYDKNY